MRDACHRCGEELLEQADMDGDLLFCPRCGAPQIRISEHLQTGAVEAAGGATTGAVPPPVPREVDWRAAVRACALVAGVGGVLTLGALATGVLSLLNVLWVLGAAIVTVGLYRRQAPATRMTAKVGARVGVLAGTMLCGAMLLALACGGTVARMTGRSASFDAEMDGQFATLRQQMGERLKDQGQDAAVSQHVLGFMEAPEARAGLTLAYLGVLGVVVVLVSAGGGAFAGMLRTTGERAAGRRR